MTSPTTIVWVAKQIRTLDPQRPIAEALVTRNGTISFIGSKRDAIAHAGADAPVEVFPSSTIVPGLIDAHAHIMSLGRALSLVALEDAASEDEVIARLKKAGPGSYEGDWLVGRGWNQTKWPAQKFPTRASLDAAFPHTPVYLTRVDGHAAWVNSEALRRVNLTKGSADPQGGRFERTADHELTGVLIDNAMNVVEQAIPKPSDDVRQHRLIAALTLCTRKGLTQIHDAGMDMATFRLLQNWDLLGRLPVRIYVMADGQGAEAADFLGNGPYTGRFVEMRTVKLLADGALGSRGAALHAPYSDAPRESGLLLLSDDELKTRAKQFAERGFQVAIHAIGDKANTLVIDTLSALPKEGRHRVEHVQVLRPDDVPRLAEHGLIASFQPTHATSDMPWAEQRLGSDRARFAYAWKSVLDTGAPMAFGSDFPIEDPNPLWGIYSARTRQDHHGQPAAGWHPEQRMSGEQALAGFTTGAAYASFAENRRGMLRVGFDADFVVLPVDPVDGDPKQLIDAAVQVTVINGVDVFRAQTAQ